MAREGQDPRVRRRLRGSGGRLQGQVRNEVLGRRPPKGVGCFISVSDRVVAVETALVLPIQLPVSLTVSVVLCPFLENGDNDGTCVNIFE